MLYVDIETRSPVDLKTCGLYRYVNDPGFRILLIQYAYDDDPVTVIDLTDRPRTIFDEGGPGYDPADLERFFNGLHDRLVRKVAHNAAFERTCLERHFGTYQPVTQWDDTMLMAAYNGLPMSLDAAGAALGIEEQKLDTGKTLINWFCKPKPDGTFREPADYPEKWAAFKAYAKRDVEAERAIHKRLRRSYVLTTLERRILETDTVITERGVLIDKTLAESAVRIDAAGREAALDEMRRLTGLTNPNSIKQLTGWLSERGYDLAKLDKAAVAGLLSDRLPDTVRRVLELRQQLCKTSVTKYEAMLRAADTDGRVRGILQYYGAGRTGRWAGRLVQVQNLPQNHLADIELVRELVRSGDTETLEMCYDSIPDVLSQLIRTAFVAPEGKTFLVADYSAIEARVTAYLAGEKWRMEVFANGGDIYCMSASQMFKVPVVKHGVNGHLRQKGKVAELACIAEGQLVETNRGLVPIESVRLDDLVWDGVEYVHHDGVVCRGEKEVITYGGLIATADHPVFVREPGRKPRTVPLGLAASRGAHLVRPAYCREDLRLGDASAKLPESTPLCKTVSRVYDILNAGPRHRFTVSGVLVHNCGYGGGVNALKAFGADKMGLSEQEMADIVSSWRAASPNVCRLWRDLETAARNALHLPGRAVPVFEHGQKIAEYRRDADALRLTLPSGRVLSYWGAGEDEENNLFYYGQNQMTRRWERIKTWGGKLVENCFAAGTPVLTRAGWKPIERVTNRDIIWDGVGWVPCNGSACRGERTTIVLNGLRVTKDHKIKTEEGWKCAEECDGLYGASVRIPDRYQRVGKERYSRSDALDGEMSMRQPSNRRHTRFETGCASRSACILWLSKGKSHLRSAHNARDVETSSLRCLAFDEAALSQSEASCLEKLRRSRNYGLRPVARKLREFLGRHGRYIRAGLAIRPDRQQQGIFSGKLPLGELLPEYAEPAEQPFRRYPNRANDRRGVIRKNRNRRNDAVISNQTWNPVRITVNHAEFQENVYDILNSGPRHQYVVRSDAGPLIVHNCVQAFARDCLAVAMVRLEEAGWHIVFHVHDEVIVEAPAGSRWEDVADIMGQPLDWAPGLLLRGDGFSSEFYMK